MNQPPTFNILVVGAGLMGPAAAYNAMKDPSVARVTLIDRDQSQLDTARVLLSVHSGYEKLNTATVDLADTESAAELFADHDAALAALHWDVSLHAFRAALAAGVPIVDLAIPIEGDLPELRRQVEQANGTVLLGCGLEPGLTEIMARYLATGLDSVDELHIKCGGIPDHPVGPLGYRIVFGGKSLPLRAIDALVIEDGKATMAPRYSGLEMTWFEGVGEVEAWHEGVLAWMLDLPELRGLRNVTQKTLRWPGYAMKATMLNDLGLLSTEPIEVNGQTIVPKNVVDAVLYPHVRLREDEGDITLFRVDLTGVKDGQRVSLRAEMIDRMDSVRGFTSMARTTAFTGMIAARMIARHQINERGLFTAEQLFDPSRFQIMMSELAQDGIRFTI